MELKNFHAEASEALGANEEQAPALMREFIEKWVPVITNEFHALRQEKSLLELQLTEAQSALEE